MIKWIGLQAILAEVLGLFFETPSSVHVFSDLCVPSWEVESPVTAVRDYLDRKGLEKIVNFNTE